MFTLYGVVFAGLALAALIGFTTFSSVSRSAGTTTVMRKTEILEASPLRLERCTWLCMRRDEVLAKSAYYPT